MKLNIKAFGLAGGVFCAVGIFICAFLAPLWGMPEIVVWIAKGYKGYSSDLVGALIGAIWGFVDAGIGCVIFAWLYNKFSQK